MRMTLSSAHFNIQPNYGAWTQITTQKNSRDYLMITNTGKPDLWIDFNGTQDETESVSLPAGTSMDFGRTGVRNEISARSKRLIQGSVEVLTDVL